MRSALARRRTSPGDDQPGRLGPQDAVRRRHDEGGRHALVGDVADDHAELAVGQLEEVVEVPADLARRLVVRGDVPPGQIGQLLGQELLLDQPGDVQFLLDALAGEGLRLLLADQLRHADGGGRVGRQVLEQPAVVGGVLPLRPARAQAQHADELPRRHQRHHEADAGLPQGPDARRVQGDAVHRNRPRDAGQVAEQGVVGAQRDVGRLQRRRRMLGGPRAPPPGQREPAPTGGAPPRVGHSSALTGARVLRGRSVRRAHPLGRGRVQADTPGRSRPGRAAPSTGPPRPAGLQPSGPRSSELAYYGLRGLQPGDPHACDVALHPARPQPATGPQQRLRLVLGDPGDDAPAARHCARGSPARPMPPASVRRGRRDRSALSGWAAGGATGGHRRLRRPSPGPCTAALSASISSRSGSSVLGELLRQLGHA